MFIDTHAHIYSEYYEDIDKVINDSKDDNINLIINNACDKASMREILSLLPKFPNMYGALGIQPEYSNYLEDDIKFLEEHLKDEKIVAVGEIGLDYHYDNYDKEKEIELFEKQLSLAEKYHLPVIVHSRNATKDTIDILKKYNVKGVIHCFSGSYETANEYIKLGFYLGVGGVSTFKNANVKDVIKKVGVNHIVFETDSPFLAPEPVRGTKNYPGNIKYIANFIADYTNTNINELSNITNKNVYAIFDKINS